MLIIVFYKGCKFLIILALQLEHLAPVYQLSVVPILCCVLPNKAKKYIRIAKSIIIIIKLNACYNESF